MFQLFMTIITRHWTSGKRDNMLKERRQDQGRKCPRGKDGNGGVSAGVRVGVAEGVGDQLEGM